VEGFSFVLLCVVWLLRWIKPSLSMPASILHCVRFGADMRLPGKTGSVLVVSVLVSIFLTGNLWLELVASIKSKQMHTARKRVSVICLHNQIQFQPLYNEKIKKK